MSGDSGKVSAVSSSVEVVSGFSSCTNSGGVNAA